MMPLDPPSDSPKILVPNASANEIPSLTPTIPGASTTVTAFVGTALSGSAGAASEPLSSFTEFELLYGGTDPIQFGDGTSAVNYLALAVWAFFENGGRQLYISRVTAPDGTNSAPPTAADYARALAVLEGIAVSIIAAPGGTVAGATGIAAVVPVHLALIAHVERSAAYRFAVLDPPARCSLTDVQLLRGQIASNSAALYYPWIIVSAPSTNAEIQVPPSGAICGIYVDNDMQNGVFKAPANITIRGAIGFEFNLNEAENGVLNPLGINCLRSFPNRGYLVWGARTVSSDPQWRYVNVRRYLLYLEQSINDGTKYAVFEPNTEKLWTTVQASISNFLYAEWRRGALLGAKPEEAYFVKCDRTTMTQTDIDSGQLICLIGVAMIQPAEFVIFQISQMTEPVS